MSQAIRIDDLAAPRFSDSVREMLAGVASVTVDLSVDAILGAARVQTGLEDFGSRDFVKRLNIIVASMNEDRGLSALGRLTNFAMLQRFAVNRLRVEDLLQRHPEIHDIEISKPIIVAGLARSGTTHLLNLLSVDPALRSLPYWEALEPVPVAGEPPGPGGEDARLLRCRDAIAMQDQVMPLFRLMFDLQPERSHEEIELLALDFSTMFIENLGLLPRWRDYYLAQDQSAHYRYLKKVLKVLQWLRGPQRWVLKTPQHLEQFKPLMKVFPDATVVITHRDPVATIASMATMVAYAARISRDPVDPIALGRYWAGRIEQMLHACVRDRERIPQAQSIDVRFDQFNADDLGTVERIYQLAGQPFGEPVRAAMQRFISDNPRGRDGRVQYDLAALGLDHDELRERLRFYSERFGAPDERIG